MSESKWFIAALVIEIRVTGDPRNVVHTNYHLIEAMTPEEAFDRAWAHSLLERSRLKTVRYLASKGKEQYFQAFLRRRSGTHWSAIAQRFETTSAAVRSWVGYVEKTHRRFLRDEIAGTVSGKGNLDQELAELGPFLKAASREDA